MQEMTPLPGAGASDLMVGGAGNDTVTGGLGNDVLVGGTGNDILTGGGGGNDRFVFAEAGPANVDTITDYDASRNDVIDLSPLLDSHFGPTDNPADFARLVQNGSDVVVQADLDGAANGQNWDSVAVLQRLRHDRTGCGPRPFRQHDLRHACVTSSASIFSSPIFLRLIAKSSQAPDDRHF